MHKSNLVTLSLLLFTSIFGSNVYAQEKSKILGTNLHIILKEGYTLDENSPSILHQDYAISIIEMAGIDFSTQAQEFASIDAEYATKGITVKKNVAGKIGQYDAQLITIDSEPALFQVIFGDKSFCAMANVVGNETVSVIDEEEIKSLLNSIEYKTSEQSPLEEHANFVITEENSDWAFESYVANVFGFDNIKTEDALLIIQLPAEAAQLHTEEDLAKQFLAKFQSTMPNLEIMEQGKWKTKNSEGFRMVLNIAEGKNAHVGLIYMYIFNSVKSVFAVQGMGKINDAQTLELFNSFVENLAPKE